MPFHSIRRAAVHMSRGYTSVDAGPYVRVDCDNGHSHYVSQDEFQAAVALAGRFSVARAATPAAVVPSEGLSALLAAASNPPHPDTRGSMAREESV